MVNFQSLSVVSDRVISVLLAGLELEFGRGAAEALAAGFIAAEECDFIWDARVEERWLGAYEALEEEGFEFDRVAVIGSLDGHWFAAICIVDGDGNSHGMIGRRSFSDVRAARRAFETLH